MEAVASAGRETTDTDHISTTTNGNDVVGCQCGEGASPCRAGLDGSDLVLLVVCGGVHVAWSGEHRGQSTSQSLLGIMIANPKEKASKPTYQDQ